jgi:hypothetical protein
VSTWIFQGNPDEFEVDAYVRSTSRIRWSVRQQHLAPKMSIGDVVYIWRSAGRERRSYGMIAEATIIGLPSVLPEDPAAVHLWRNPRHTGPRLRVKLDLVRVIQNEHQLVPGTALRQEPDLRELRILRLRQETNYLVKPAHERRLRTLWERTGRDWTHDESLAALWAYDLTFGKPVAEKTDGAVSEVSTRTGRLLTAVVSKLMNFRSIDPREVDPKGLQAASVVDREVWNEYFDSDSQTIRSDALGIAFATTWVLPDLGRGRDHDGSSRPSSFDGIGPVSDPSDDPEVWERIARRVRRGQEPFRRVLLEQYGSECAIAGRGPAIVLHAAHILPHATTGRNDRDNGLLLRADIHDLFDEELLWINPETLAVEVDISLNGTDYEALRGRKLRVRKDGKNPVASRRTLMNSRRELASMKRDA